MATQDPSLPPWATTGQTRRQQFEAMIPEPASNGDQLIANSVANVVSQLMSLTYTLDSHMSNLVAGQDRTARAMLAILEHQEKAIDDLITQLRMSELKANHWEKESRRLAAATHVVAEPPELGPG